MKQSRNGRCTSCRPPPPPPPCGIRIARATVLQQRKPVPAVSQAPFRPRRAAQIWISPRASGLDPKYGSYFGDERERKNQWSAPAPPPAAAAAAVRTAGERERRNRWSAPPRRAQQGILLPHAAGHHILLSHATGYHILLSHAAGYHILLSHATGYPVITRSRISCYYTQQDIISCYHTQQGILLSAPATSPPKSPRERENR